MVYTNSVNESGAIVGEYRDADNVAHALVIVRGAFHAVAGVDGRMPVPGDIDERQGIPGAARKTAEDDRGFLLDRGNCSFLQCDTSGHTNPAGIRRNDNVAGTCGAYANLRGFVFRGGFFDFATHTGTLRTQIREIDDRPAAHWWNASHASRGRSDAARGDRRRGVDVLLYREGISATESDALDTDWESDPRASSFSCQVRGGHK